MSIFEPLGDDPRLQEQSAILGRRILVVCLMCIVGAWVWQSVHAGGSSPLMKETFVRYGAWATTGPIVLLVLLVFALFRRWAKIAAGFVWGYQCGILGLAHLSAGRYDLVLLMVGMGGVGMVLALLAKAGMGR